MPITPLDYFNLSENSYGEGELLSEEMIAQGWRVVQYGGEVIHDHEESGYAGVAYVNDQEQMVVFAHRGTEFLSDFNKDVIQADVDIAMGKLPRQFTHAREFTTGVLTSNDFDGYEIAHTGHSLGGGLAQLVAASTGSSAITFDNPGVGDIINDMGLHNNSFDSFHAFTSRYSWVSNGFNGEVAAVNNHVGNVHTIDPILPDEIRIFTPLTNHSMSNMRNAFDETTGFPANENRAYMDEMLRMKWEKNGILYYEVEDRGTRAFRDSARTEIHIQDKYDSFEEYRDAYYDKYDLDFDQSYYQHFVSLGEQLAGLARELNDGLARLGYAVSKI